MKIIIFDTETTGIPMREAALDAQPYVTQFAAIIYDFNPLTRVFQEVSRYDQYIKPPISITSESSRITGITDETVANSPAFKVVTPSIAKLFAECDIAVAHNLEFDRFIMAIEFERAGISTNFLPPQIYCSMERTRDLCKLPGRSGGYKAPRLMELHQFLLGQSFQEAHNAIKDVEALARCVKVLLTQGFYQPTAEAQVIRQTEIVQESLF